MFTAYDYKRIQTQEYLLDENEMASLQDCLRNLTFPDQIKKIFNTVINRYSQSFPPDFALNSKQSEGIINELLLQLLNFLSIYTSKCFSSSKEFFETIRPFELVRDQQNEKPSPEKIAVTYRTSKSFQKAFNDLKFRRSTQYEEIIVSAPSSKDTYALREQIENKVLLKNTPLFDYFLSLTKYATHEYRNSQKSFQGECKPTQPTDTFSTKDRTEILPFVFRLEGRYFTAVLLRALKSKGLPYLKSSYDGISLQALNNLLKTMYYAYQRGGLFYCNDLEQLLFLINAENIFHLSLAHTIFTDYNLLLTQYGSSSKLGFKYSFQLLFAMRLCPLDSLSLALWDTYKEKFFNEGANNEKYGFIEQIWGITSSLTQDAPTCLACNFQEMIDCLNYLILKANNCFPSEDSSTHMVKLKNDILYYFSKSPAKKLSWSLLETTHNNLNDKALYIPSTFSHFFNFLLIHALFLPFDQPFDSFMRELNLDYAVNRYIEFLLNHKKEK